MKWSKFVHPILFMLGLNIKQNQSVLIKNWKSSLIYKSNIYLFILRLKNIKISTKRNSRKNGRLK